MQTVRKLMQAGSAGDTATLQQLFTRDCVLHVAGSHAMAGEHKGQDAVLDTVRRFRTESNETVHAEPQQMFLDGRGHVVATYRLTADRRGRRHDALGALHCTFVGGRIASVEVYEQDLDQTNQFWS
jgi:ketosteroid isomerase-like protein